MSAPADPVQADALVEEVATIIDAMVSSPTFRDDEQRKAQRRDRRQPSCAGTDGGRVMDKPRPHRGILPASRSARRAIRGWNGRGFAYRDENGDPQWQDALPSEDPPNAR